MKPTFLILLNFWALLSSGKGDNLPIHCSADCSGIYLYLTKGIAISKRTAVEGDGVARTYFTVGTAHWVGQPEYADETGDELITPLIDFPVQGGMSEDKKWLVIEGKSYIDHTPDTTNAVAVVELKSGKVYSGHSLAAVEQQAGIMPSSFAPDFLAPVEVFFDKELISRLTSK